MKNIITIGAMLCASTLLAFRVNVFAPANGEEFTCDDGGKIVAVEAYSPTQASGTVALKSIYSAAVYTNAVVLLPPVTSIVHTVVWSNTVDAVVTTNSYNSLAVHVPLHLVALSSNTVYSVSVTTNTWPVLKEIAAKTNSVVSGTCTSNVYSAAPGSTTYLAPGEKLVFEGTATGGWLRLILE